MRLNKLILKVESSNFNFNKHFLINTTDMARKQKYPLVISKLLVE